MFDGAVPVAAVLWDVWDGTWVYTLRRYTIHSPSITLSRACAIKRLVHQLGLFKTKTNIANGLHFGVYGPGDQGAFNMFYAGQFEVRLWPSWNWKPYWGYQSDAKLLHFHGPKPRSTCATWTARCHARCRTALR